MQLRFADVDSDDLRGAASDEGERNVAAAGYAEHGLAFSVEQRGDDVFVFLRKAKDEERFHARTSRMARASSAAAREVVLFSERGKRRDVVVRDGAEKIE